MEHIDEKLTRLHQYHLIINDIAEALGYRTGQTYEPVELSRMVKELIRERDMTIEACRGTQMDDAGIWSVKELVKKLATVEAERDFVREQLAKAEAEWDEDWREAMKDKETILSHSVYLNDRLAAVEAERDDLREQVNAMYWGETVASVKLEQLHRILTALREPSEAVGKAAADEMYGIDVDCVSSGAEALYRAAAIRVIRAAVAAAENEVLHDEGLSRIGQRNAKLFKRSDEEVTDAN